MFSDPQYYHDSFLDELLVEKDNFIDYQKSFWQYHIERNLIFSNINTSIDDELCNINDILDRYIPNKEVSQFEYLGVIGVLNQFKSKNNNLFSKMGIKFRKYNNYF